MTTDEVPASSTALTRLEEAIAPLGRVVVAFSGGIDSGLVAYVATKVLRRESALVATAVSPSLAEEERADCEALAKEWDLRHVFVATNEVESLDYARNDLNRCYHCKHELMNVLGELAASEGATIVLGVNLDDLNDHRPGQRAAKEGGAAFPLVEAGIDKQEVRRIAKELGLRIWDKPAAACLASRVPHGTPVTIGVLSRVARAESVLRRLGFRELRVRHYGDSARLELGVADLEKALASREEIVEGLHAVGYRYVTLDLEGLRSGNLSRTALETA